ncbi:MAG: hypothetical protein FJY75_03875 [Candidatus Eisenbacteria bacterium]|uniref:Uncharacterized protein n=1 Tax=Eiseniibacteriota bacterium TaxID=2212470 RepID=A0A937XA05_UNCEI|nr:hypothetical protein [Candidatus Eisenbacteria bacterium]
MIQRHAPAILGCALLALAALVAGGCDAVDQPRSSLVVTEIVPATATGSLATSPLRSDVRHAGEDGVLMTADDAVFEDEVRITVENRPASAQLGLAPGGPFGSVTLNAYRVEFEITGEQIDSLEGALHAVVPSGESVSLVVVLVTGAAKLEPPLSSLILGGELQGDARVTLYGVEQTSGDEIAAEAAIRVHFANWADED